RRTAGPSEDGRNHAPPWPHPVTVRRTGRACCPLRHDPGAGVKAIVCHRYGAPEALRLEDVDKPTPGDGEVLIRVRASSLNAYDWGLMRGRPPILRMFLGLRRPKVNRPGRDVAGRVESVGRSVTQFKPGDDAFGMWRGSLAEYACASDTSLVAQPANVSFEAAAAVPLAGLTALQGLRECGRIQ